MKISIPNLPVASPSNPAYINPLVNLTLPQAVQKIQDFLEQGKGQTLVLTGAGVSVDSGIRAYRGDKGRYTTNPNYRPIFYGELVEPGPRGHKFRQRYWSRSYLGYPPVRDSQPNPTHMYIACLQLLGLAPQVITQNVDRLHHKASAFSDRETDARILELHGTLHFVHCIPHGHIQTRDAYQTTLGRLNPKWEEVVMNASGGEVKTNPDGDVELGGANYDEFVVPGCPECERLAKLKQRGVSSASELDGLDSIVKPNVVFFGETIADPVKERSMSMIAKSSQLLVLGTSLATYSAFRLIKQALEASKPVLMVSTGPSRADGMTGVEKIEMEAGPLLRDVLKQYTKRKRGSVGQEILRMMDSGVVKEAADLKTSPTISHDEGSTMEAPRNAIFGGDFSLATPMRRFSRSRREFSTASRREREERMVQPSRTGVVPDAFSWRPVNPASNPAHGEGPLAGRALAIKDNFMLRGAPTSACSMVIKGLESPYTATSVRLLQRAGACIIGKTQMDEFGMGSFTTNLPEGLGPVHNPFRPVSPESEAVPRSAGGSSGGSAAAVASGEAWAALGTDTGGSVRLPASYCGIVGLKPSYGMVSRHGIVSYADSLDCVGILAGNVEIARKVFGTISQPDERDATCVSSEVRRKVQAEAERHPSFGHGLQGVRVGVPKEAWFDASLTPLDTRPLLKGLRSAGAILVPVSIPSIRLSLPAYYVIACAEASSNLARYGGEFFGSSAPSGAPQDRLSVRTWGFGDEVTTRVLAGTHALTAGAFENSYLKAMHLRRTLKVEMDSIFRQRRVLAAKSTAATDGVDVLLHLTATRTAPPLASLASEEEAPQSYEQDLLTVPASLAGLPCISLPGGVGSDGWPVGVSLTAQWGMDEMLLDVASQAESTWLPQAGND